MATSDLRGDSSSHLKGINSRLYVREEGAYGEPYADSFSYEDYHLGLVPGSVITQEQSTIPVNSFTGDKSYLPHEFGRKTTGGIYGFNLNCQTLNKIFSHALGNPQSDILDFSEDRKEFIEGGLGFLQVVDGTTDATGYVSYFSGNRIGSLTVNCPSNDSLVQVFFSFVGKEAKFFNKSEVIAPTGIERLVENVFPSWNSRFTLTKGDEKQILAFRDFSFTVNNNPIVSNYIDGSDSLQACDIQLGRRQITGRFTLPLLHKENNHNTIQYINDYFNKESFQLSFTCYTEDYVEGGNNQGFDVFSIYLPKVIFSADVVPRQIDHGVIGFDVEFTAFSPISGYSEIKYYMGTNQTEDLNDLWEQ